ncbi:hypothetical protein C0581_01880 [Candidatus Parcubacteria bacterium]|nr:MAG: hypothetical protein C0581_01880 [Candidatus Parcubacteria bacterium]
MLIFFFIPFVNGTALTSDLFHLRSSLLFVGLIGLLLLQFKNKVILIMASIFNLGLLMFIIFQGHLVRSFLLLINYQGSFSIYYSDLWLLGNILGGLLIIITVAWNLIFTFKIYEKNI